MKECIGKSSKMKGCILIFQKWRNVFENLSKWRNVLENVPKWRNWVEIIRHWIHSYGNGTPPTCYTSYVKPMIMSNFGETLLTTCFTIKRMKKQQKLNFHDNPKHEATNSSNSGPRKKMFVLTRCSVNIFHPMLNRCET